MRLVALVFFCFLISCKGQKKVLPNHLEDADTIHSTLSPLLLLSDHYGDSKSIEDEVIGNEKRLRSFFAVINRTRKPGVPVPEVDFSKEVILLVFGDPQKENRLLEILMESDDKIIFKKNKIENTDKVGPIPFNMYKMPITSKEISFKNRK